MEGTAEGKPETEIDTKTAAALLGIQPGTLELWRADPSRPQPRAYPRSPRGPGKRPRVYYLESEVLAFKEALKQEPARTRRRGGAHG